MSAITTESMITEFFEIWEKKVSGGLSPKNALAEIEIERPDLAGFYSHEGKTPLARSLKKGGQKV